MIIVNKSMMTIALLGLYVLASTVSLPVHAAGHFKLKYEKQCGTDPACLVFNYCTGCHQGLVVGTSVISEGLMKPPPGNYKEWVSRLERMSYNGYVVPFA